MEDHKLVIVSIPLPVKPLAWELNSYQSKDNKKLLGHRTMKITITINRTSILNNLKKTTGSFLLVKLTKW